MLAIYFNPSGGPGHKTHYFHFLHGYLLPGLQLALQSGAKQVWFEYCGPLMQPRIQEACNLLSIELVPHTIEPNNMPAILAPRWDNILLYFDNPPLSESTCCAFEKNCRELRKKLIYAAEHSIYQHGNIKKWNNLDMIVFKRSEEHPYYTNQHPKDSSNYGRGRRALQNEKDILLAFQREGLRAIDLDFGTLTLAQQIVACQATKAVLGIRGAEFANLIWMQRGATAVMLTDPIARENNGTRSLAKIFKQSFLAFPVKSNKVSLNDFEIRELVDSYFNKVNEYRDVV